MANELTKGIVFEYIETTLSWFDIRTLDRELSIESPQGKTNRRQILHRLVKDGLIERHSFKEGFYRIVDKNLDEIDFLNADPTAFLDLKWPMGEDDTDFHLQHAKIYPKSTITLTGVKNTSKTLFALQFMFRNMDKYHCVYHSCEMSAEEIAGRLQFFQWVDWKQKYKEGRFKIIERFDNYPDVIKQYPNSIHCIDWIDPGRDAYMIGEIIKSIRKPLDKGIALIAIQKKSEDADYGAGGQYGEHLARMVMHLGFNKLWIKSCKAWNTEELSGKKFSFDVTGHGSKYCNIQEVKS